MSNGPFEISDEEFWSDPLKHRNNLIRKHAMSFRKTLIIDGPEAVDLELRKTLPISALYLAPQTDTFAFDFRSVAIVIVSRLEDRAVFCDMAFDPITAPREPVTAKPDASTFSGGTYVLGLESHPILPWKPASYLVTVLVRDLVSNRIRTKLSDGPGKYKDPEVEKFLKSQKKPSPNSASPTPGNPYPHYNKWEKSPSLPDSEGIALNAERVIITKPGHRVVISGSFRLAPLTAEKSSNAVVGGPQAFISITLVFVGTENSFPLPFAMRVPAYGSSDSDMLTGHFNLDALQVPQFDSRPQTYFLYAFAGEAMAGPLPVGLVTEDMLSDPNR